MMTEPPIFICTGYLALPIPCSLTRVLNAVLQAGHHLKKSSLEMSQPMAEAQGDCPLFPLLGAEGHQVFYVFWGLGGLLKLWELICIFLKITFYCLNEWRIAEFATPKDATLA